MFSIDCVIDCNLIKYTVINYGLNAEFVISNRSSMLTVSVHGADCVEGADLGAEVWDL